MKQFRYWLLFALILTIGNITLEIIMYNFIPIAFYYYNLPFLYIFDKLPEIIQAIFIYSEEQTDFLFATNIILISTIQLMILGTVIGLLYWQFFKKQKNPKFKTKHFSPHHIFKSSGFH